MTDTGASGKLREHRLRRLRRLTRILDTAINIPGTGVRVGADSLVGLIPGLGDGAMALLSLYVVFEAARLGASKKALRKMLLNVAIDFGAGSVPLAGDAFDVFFKANLRNIRLLEADLKQKAS